MVLQKKMMDDIHMRDLDYIEEAVGTGQHFR
jgi:hypothetical protein